MTGFKAIHCHHYIMAKRWQMVTIFNKQLKQFVEEAFIAFPDARKDNNITDAFNSIVISQAITPDASIQLFYNEIMGKYDKQIDDRDEDFFLSCTDYNLPFIDSIKELYKGASMENKNTIWEYIVKLKKIAIKYHSLKNEK